MQKSAFYQVVTDREVQNLLETIANQSNTAISIENDREEILIQTIKSFESCPTQKYPIDIENERVGWAIVPEKLAWISSWLSYLYKQKLEKQELLAKVWEREQEINLFQDISTQIALSLEVREVTHLVLEEAGKFIPCTWGAISLLNISQDELEIYSEFGQKLPNRTAIYQTDNLRWNTIEYQTGEILYIREDVPRHREYQDFISSLICVPLKVQNKTIGALEVGSEVLVEYTADDLKIMTMFAEQAAIAIEKALLYEQSQNATTIAQEQTAQLQQALHDLRQTQSQLVQSEKMSSLGELLAGVSHEINNPVNFINGNLTHVETYAQDLIEMLQLYQKVYPESRPEIESFAEEIELEYLIEDLPKLIFSMQEGVRRICQILLSLRNFSRQDRGKKFLVNVHDCLDSTLLILKHRLKNIAPYKEIKIIQNYSELPKIYCYPGQLNQVFMNLLGNAIDAIEELYEKNDRKPTQPQIEIQTEMSNDNQVAIRIADNGIGMDEEIRSQLFDSFFTTKPLGKGTGLGLSICHQIITQKHGGSLQCTSKRGKGTEFIIELPIAMTE
ncbi:MAG: ATP-binding protein [Geitlerinemataceae cyanobacterium]